MALSTIGVEDPYYLGANASWLVVDTTAYLTYRRHFGSTADSDIDYAFDLHVLYLGIMFGAVGLNVAFRKSEW